jgi:cytochrome P450/NADPH-cytochrome P450 reductase
MHPFVLAMVSALAETQARVVRPSIATYLMRGTKKKYDADTEILRETAREMLQENKARPTTKHNLLNAMLNGRDPKTGSKMTDESIIDNILTFLIAGAKYSTAIVLSLC